ncbi:unnamed protein product [Lampetra planeri]
MASFATARGQVYLGELPHDFLRISPTAEQQAARPNELARPMLPLGRLSITVMQARLVKNYGVTRMDPYCRIRAGYAVCETPTAQNGAKNPRWNKTIHCNIPPGVDFFYLEIFDERAFSTDDRIAWAHIPIAEHVKRGETADEWFLLSGRQGEDKEGTINLLLQYTVSSALLSMVQPQPQETLQAYYQSAGYIPVAVGEVVVVPGGEAAAQPPSAPPQAAPAPDTEVQALREVFPGLEPELVRSVLEAQSGNREAAINALLQISN